MIWLKKIDPQIYQLIKQEEKRTESTLEMIPSNNYPSRAVLEALGSILNYKYSEGYPRKGIIKKINLLMVRKFWQLKERKNTF